MLVMNKSIHKSLQIYLEALKPSDDDFLFASRKSRRSITIQCVNNMVKKWVGEINLKGKLCAHSLRKDMGICSTNGLMALDLRYFVNGLIIQVRLSR